MRHDWNTVVVGHWNRAILTPAGIATKLFGVAEGTPVVVEVPMDVVAAYRVRHDGLCVSLEGTRLSVATDVSDFSGLERAMRVGKSAVEKLPLTPLIAAGMNIRYRYESIDPSVADLTRAQLESLVSDRQFRVTQRSSQLGLDFQQGLINLSVLIPTQGPVEVSFNFHRATDNPDEVESWLSIPVVDLERAVTGLREALGLPAEDIE